MKGVVVSFTALLLAGCATPKPIVDTASRVATMSDAMDRSFTNYVNSLKSVRQADEQRLKEMRGDARRRKMPVQEQLQILAVAEDDRPVRVMSALAIPPAADPLGVDTDLAAPSAEIKFDDTSLKSVATIARDIARPATAAEEFKVLVSFAKTVDVDLQKATDSNNKQGGSSPQP